jgi:SAM-dependent methyltransferase
MAASPTRSHGLGVLEYLSRGRTPVRELQDRAIARFLPTLTGKVIELGALGDGRREFATGATEYRVSNVVDGVELYLDASAMSLDSDSIDGFVCESMLEHVKDPTQLISEIRRVLKPGGHLLMLTPWMYPFHAAPDDYLRFSESALVAALSGFRVKHLEPLGNFWTMLSTFSQLKVQPWKAMKKSERISRLLLGGPLLGLGLGSYALSRVLRENDDFATMYVVVAEKLAPSP